MINRTRMNPSEHHDLAWSFCLENGETSFLLKRLKAHDKFLYEHSLRAAYFSLLLAQGLGLSAREQEIVYRSALLMDFGKLQIVPSNKRKGQSEPDGHSVLDHPRLTVQAISAMAKAGLVDRDAILAHHENLDGTGYPYGLMWEDISLHARILRVADSFASLTAHDARSRSLTGIDNALGELYRWSDIHYDADLVELLCHYYGNDFGRKEDSVKTRVIKLINH
ncbi:HD-GYP domain-containing protein [Gorillibacterium timonense]|uniref:HD-GYP domain-containing protein n=1 Tax=Gorillibacterium timonense TaxID=1689269 RepID=UPI0009EB1C3E|nr:HD domain-containing phosphohydrolase [Gorillibacterium timonense]